MSTHTITFTSGEESVYQKYLVIISKTDEEMMTALKNDLAKQVVQRINEEGYEKFKKLTVSQKLAFLTEG